ncbi:MAG: MlaD family protein [Myxococcota bacterium]
MPRLSYTQIGALTISLLAGLSLVIGVVAYRSLAADTETYRTYFSETVQGLAIGSSTKFRGVNVGSVVAIAVAPDGEHIAVTVELSSAKKELLHFDDHPNGMKLCAQLTAVGLTGTKVIQFDYFSPDACEAATELPFDTQGEKTIASATSVLADLEEAVHRVSRSVPTIVTDLSRLIARTDAIAAQFEREGLPQLAAAWLRSFTATLDRIDARVAALDTRRLSRDTRLALKDLRQTSASMRRLMEEAGSRDGLLRSATRTSTALGDLAQGLQGNGREMRQLVRDLSDAARAVRRFTDTLERDPDMLLKGRADVTATP